MPLTVTDRILPPLRKPWQMGVAVGRAYELLRADVQEHLAHVRRSVGFRYCRFHGLFHDDMLVALRDAQGGLHFQWNQVDKVLDFLLSIGMKPFVELGPMPGALASGPTTFFYWRMNVTPPRDWDEWELLVEQFARHCVRRYGIEEVRSWYFEVWNEPNLRAFWDGTWEEYVELYARSAAALKRVDDGLQIGGPASAEAKKVPEFLTDCEAAGVSVDFVSTHVYPQNEWNWYEGESPHRPGEFFFATVRNVKEQVRGKHVYLTEWNALSARTRDEVDWTDNPSIDRSSQAGFIARACIELDDASDGMFWWVASDVFEEAGIAQSPFSSTYGLLTIDGIPKASMRTFELLSQLRGERLEIGGTFPDGKGACSVRDGEILRILLWNDESVENPNVWTDALEVPFEGPAVLTELTVGPGAFEAWQQMGSPQKVTPLQLQSLRLASEPRNRIEVRNSELGAIRVPIRLEPGEVALIEIAPRCEVAHKRELYSDELSLWNRALGEKAET